MCKKPQTPCDKSHQSLCPLADTTDDHTLLWLLNHIRVGIPELIVQVRHHRHTRAYAFFVTATYERRVSVPSLSLTQLPSSPPFQALTWKSSALHLSQLTARYTNPSSRKVSQGLSMMPPPCLPGSLLRGADELGLRKAVKAEFGGGTRGFSCEEDFIYENVESELRFFTSQVRPALAPSVHP